VGYDLSIDGGGPVPAGIANPARTPVPLMPTWLWFLGLGLIGIVALGAVGDMRRPPATLGTG
jgi:hypothetical protein